jgi:hypothetical protein
MESGIKKFDWDAVAGWHVLWVEVARLSCSARRRNDGLSECDRRVKNRKGIRRKNSKKKKFYSPTFGIQIQGCAE